MGRRLIAKGTDLQRQGARALRIVPTRGVDPFGRSYVDHGSPQFVEPPAFAYSTTEHHHYEIPGLGYPAPFDASGGTFWALCSTTPPGPGIWPGGYRELVMVTDDPQASGAEGDRARFARTGGQTKKVYMASDLVLWIPNNAAALTSAVEDSTWNADI